MVTNLNLFLHFLLKIIDVSTLAVSLVIGSLYFSIRVDTQRTNKRNCHLAHMSNR